MEIIGIFVFSFVSAWVLYLIYYLIKQVPENTEQERETTEQVKNQKIN